MDYKKVDLQEWTLAGKGANGQVYYHKTDDSLVLKLNREDLAKDKAEWEYAVSKSVYESGIPCPQVYELVTDGKRTGVTEQRIKDKKSFVKLISEDKSQLEPLAKKFAALAKAFHSAKCDTTLFQSFKEKARATYESCDALPPKAKKLLFSYLDDMSDDTTPLHGDLHPGNIIRAGDKDYWIDLGGFTYGDPDLDMASLIIMSEYTPKQLVNYVFHNSREEMARFVEIYGAEYYGSRWHSKELDRKIHKATCLSFGLIIAEKNSRAKMFLPYVLGQKFKSKLIIRLCDLLITEKLFTKITRN